MIAPSTEPIKRPMRSIRLATAVAGRIIELESLRDLPALQLGRDLPQNDRRLLNGSYLLAAAAPREPQPACGFRPDRAKRLTQAYLVEFAVAEANRRIEREAHALDLAIADSGLTERLEHIVDENGDLPAAASNDVDGFRYRPLVVTDHQVGNGLLEAGQRAPRRSQGRPRAVRLDGSLLGCQKYGFEPGDHAVGVVDKLMNIA